MMLAQVYSEVPAVKEQFLMVTFFTVVVPYWAPTRRPTLVP